MQWNNSQNAGFSDATPWIAVQNNYPQINATAALRDSDSVFHYYQALIRLRKEMPLIQDGTIDFLYPDIDSVFAYRRVLEGEEVLVLNNLLCQKITLPCSAAGYEKLLGNDEGALIDHKTVTLRPYETLILRKIS